MKVTSMNAPAKNAPSAPSPAASARDRAIARLIEPSPVLNQNSVAPEELSAIQPRTASTEGQINKGIEVSAEEPADTQVQAPETPAPTEDPLSKQYAILAKREKALRAKALQQEQAWKTREEAFKAREAELINKTKQYEQGYISQEDLKNQTLDVLARAGVSYEELTQQMISQQPRDPRVDAHIQRLESKIKGLEESANASKQSQITAQNEAYQAAVKQIRMDTAALVKSDPTFETIKNTESVDDVVELITKTYDQDGILLSVEEAAQLVEDELTERLYKVTSKTEKLKKRLQPVAPTQASKETQPPKSVTQPQTMKTLTNATSSARPISARDRAVLAFEGKLKS